MERLRYYNIYISKSIKFFILFFNYMIEIEILTLAKPAAFEEMISLLSFFFYK